MRVVLYTTGGSHGPQTWKFLLVAYGRQKMGKSSGNILVKDVVIRDNAHWING